MADAEQIPVCRRIMRDFYGDNLPATTYIPQHPCQGKLLAIEALGVGQGKGEVEIDRISEQLVRVSHSNVTWVHCAEMTPEVGVTGCYNRSTSAFRRMRALLCSVGVRFDQVIRTWLYLGGIVADENQADCAVQRYKELNRARTDFFQGTPFLADKLPPGRPPGTVYPASTGIGSDDGDIDYELYRAGHRSEGHPRHTAGEPAPDPGLRLRDPLQPQESEIFSGDGPLLR